ncbi:hypothetical protein BH23PLA1_BH23PLA1_30570 [soil metagenome]
MSDPFRWSINLGRWAGVPVSLHLFLIIFAAFRLLQATLFDGDGEVQVEQTLGWLALLMTALSLHELGHAAAAIRLGGEPDEVRLWPLGNLQGPQPVPVSRSGETFLVALAGPLTNLAIALIIGIGLTFADARMIFNPFGHEGQGSGAPVLHAGGVAEPFSTLWWIGWFGYLNWVLFLANLIPALPLDGGRMLRAALAGPSLTSHRDGLIAPWTARTCVVILGLVGLIRLLFMEGLQGGMTLIGLAILIEIYVRMESRMLEDGDFLDNQLFGYDFSQGYTSLESSGPKVRPYRESALARWRRRRSEQRRQRQEAKEAAEEQRMDEILDKLHQQGRSALTEEEHRFLVRLSAKYRNRPRPRD